ncbi:ABC transporter permease subunit [Cohnella ginsengisoli]|uniref:ABC transporter permease subunit n=1 Tax=Cohnella ginsengisoli TaxID=425004 RepID=UPI0030B8B6CB
MRRRFSFLRGKNGELSVLFLPGFLFFLVMSYIPMVGIVIAFKDYNLRKGIFGSEWVGFDNLKFFFVSDTAWRVTRNTILYSLSYIVLTLVVSLALAILLNELTRRWIKIHQTVMFLPYFLSWVLVSYISNAFLDHQNGFLNALLKSVGMQPVEWYFGAAYWPIILNLVHLWKAVGFNVLLYYAGIMGIDQSYYEAARIDGANKLQMALKITIPLLAPLVTILLILSIGGGCSAEISACTISFRTIRGSSIRRRTLSTPTYSARSARSATSPCRPRWASSNPSSASCSSSAPTWSSASSTKKTHFGNREGPACPRSKQPQTPAPRPSCRPRGPKRSIPVRSTGG